MKVKDRFIQILIAIFMFLSLVKAQESHVINPYAFYQLDTCNLIGSNIHYKRIFKIENKKKILSEEWVFNSDGKLINKIYKNLETGLNRNTINYSYGRYGIQKKDFFIADYLFESAEWKYYDSTNYQIEVIKFKKIN